MLLSVAALSITCSSLQRIRTMANSALIVLVAATLVLLLSAGDVDAEDRWNEEQVLTFYLPAPSKIIAGPGKGSFNHSKSAFGSLSVFDLPVLEGPDENSKSIGRNRGAFLIDSYDGTNLISLCTFDFTSHAPNGSVVISGDAFALQRKSVLPIVGGTGEFSGVEGYLVQWPVVPEGPGTTVQILNAVFYSELHYKLRRP